MEKNQKSQGEIILYQPNDEVRLEVRLEDETVWLTQAQMVELFQTTKQNISLHINNVFKEHELDKSSVVKDYLTTAHDGKCYRIKYYNLDVIISIGYRVKSIRGTQFRIWASAILKEFLLRGFSINQRLTAMEQAIDVKLLEQDCHFREIEKKIDFFVRTSLPPVEGIFFNGQIFDAYAFVCGLVKSACKSIVLIDNYIDESVLMLLDKRAEGVYAVIYTKAIDRHLQFDIEKHNAQYPPIDVRVFQDSHDRFLIIDEKAELALAQCRRVVCKRNSARNSSNGSLKNATPPKRARESNGLPGGRRW